MRNSRTLVLVEDVMQGQIGRATLAEPRPRQLVEVPPSGLTDFNLSGGKCAHGVYIPGNVPGNRARDCSLCHPYQIFVRAGAEYSA